jgi:hypothetical protein
LAARRRRRRRRSRQRGEPTTTTKAETGGGGELLETAQRCFCWENGRAKEEMLCPGRSQEEVAVGT